MSLTVSVIGLLHAVPIIFAAAKSNSKIVVILTSIVMAVIAVAFGGGRYTAGDLGFVLSGCLLGILIVNLNSE